MVSDIACSARILRGAECDTSDLCIGPRSKGFLRILFWRNSPRECEELTGCDTMPLRWNPCTTN